MLTHAGRPSCGKRVPQGSHHWPKFLIFKAPEPDQGMVGIEPGQLPLGEVARRALPGVDRSREARIPRQVCPELSIPHGAQARQFRVQVAPVAQAPHLVEESVRHHPEESRVDAAVEFRPVAHREPEGCEGKIGPHGEFLQLRERLAREFEHLERALDALRIPRADARGGQRVAGSEFRIKADLVLLAMGFVGPRKAGDPA